jgi:hypothetical protein
MKSEYQAWNQLRAHAAAQLPANFPDRVLCAARSAAESAPSLFSQLTLGIATAAICFLTVAFIQMRGTHTESNRNLTDWQQIASSADFPGIDQ